MFDTKDMRSSSLRSVKVVAKKTGISSTDIAETEETKDAGYKFTRLLNTEKEVKEVSKLLTRQRYSLGLMPLRKN